MDKSTNLVWIDLEMTGLNPRTDVIIEIATIITDKDLNIIAEGPSIAIQTDQAKLEAMDEVVSKMHSDNGLLDRVRASNISLSQAEQMTLDFIKQYTEEGTSPLCGNSIATDKMFLTFQMPKIVKQLHYRLVDVSTVKQLNAYWHLQPEYKKDSTHLALDDIKESINELKYYKENIFKS